VLISLASLVRWDQENGEPLHGFATLDQTLQQTIGPQTFATVPLARQWLSQAAGKHGFVNFDIVVERLTHEDLVAEDDA
jgi:hypothetical protein